MNKNISIVLSFIFILVAGCTAENGPLQAAKDFWQAVAEKDMEKAAGYSHDGYPGSIFYDERYQITLIDLSDVRKSENRAYVGTEIEIIRDSTIRKFKFETVCVRDDHGDWKVSVNRTELSLLAHDMRSFKEEIREAGKTLGEIFMELGRSLKDIFNSEQ